jgi:tetratricopeptide (TPR) repeat protein/predicted Ser/Thr protein kinase
VTLAAAALGTPQVEDATNAPTLASGASGPPGAVSPAARLSVGDTLGDRYEISGVLGEGGCGVVYRAHDRALDRTVALKTIHPSVAANPTALERFKREILLSSKITHRNVVRIHDLGEAGSLKFISMEFIEGVDLKQIVRRDGPLPRERAIELIRQVADALRAAHEAGVVHRDLKPQNVLVDASNRAWIADFGISRSIDHGQTMTEAGALVGTVAYMSPEQAHGDVADHRSDIYALGLILYEMLTGEPPFKSDNPLSQLMKRVAQEVPTVELTRSDLPGWLVHLVARCVARDPADRYQSVAELLADLDQERTTRTPRRLRLRLPPRAWFAAGGALALLAGGAFLLWRAGPADLDAPVPVRASLLVAPFRNVTSDPRDDWTRRGLPDLLRSELVSSRDLHLADDSRVREIVGGLDLEADGLRDEELVTLSRLAGVENVLVGELVRAGDSFRVTAELVRTGAAAVASRTPIKAEGRGEDSLLAIVDELGRQVRNELRLDRPWGGDRRAEEVSTASVEALRLYIEGNTLVREGSDLGAAGRLEAALAADPDFWSARALYAEVLARLGRETEALEQIDRATAGLSEVTPYEAARIRSLRASMAGDAPAARAAHEELTRLAPNLPDAHLALAVFLEQAGELEAARAALDRVLELERANPQARYLRGRVFAKLGQSGRSIEDFQASLAHHLEAGNAEGRATALVGLGNVHRSLGERERALDYYEQALAVRREVADARGEAAVLNNVALIHQDQGEYERAIESWEQALEIYGTLADPQGEAEIHANLGDLHSALGRPQLALTHYGQGMRLLRDAGDVAGHARALANLGFVNQVLGRYDEAHLMLEQALAERRDRGDARELLMSLLDMGNLELVLGRFDRALGHYAEGLALAGQTGDRDAAIALRINVAVVHVERADYRSALANVTQALAEIEGGGNATFRAPALVALGRTRGAIGDLDEADQALTEALADAEQNENRTVAAEALIELGNLELSRGARAAAAKSFERALAIAREAEEHRLTLPARVGLAAARQSPAELVSTGREAEDAGLLQHAARAALAQAGVHREQGRPQQAAELAERALDLAPAGMRELTCRAHALAAAALTASGGRPGEHARVGLEVFEGIVADLAGDVESSQRFLASAATLRFAEELEESLEAADRERLDRLLQPGS